MLGTALENHTDVVGIGRHAEIVDGAVGESQMTGVEGVTDGNDGDLMEVSCDGFEAIDVIGFEVGEDKPDLFGLIGIRQIVGGGGLAGEALFFELIGQEIDARVDVGEDESGGGGGLDKGLISNGMTDNGALNGVEEKFLDLIFQEAFIDS